MVSKINNPFSANIKEGGLAFRSLFGGLDSSLAYSVTFSESGCAEDFAEPGIVVQGHCPLKSSRVNPRGTLSLPAKNEKV